MNSSNQVHVHKLMPYRAKSPYFGEHSLHSCQVPLRHGLSKTTFMLDETEIIKNEKLVLFNKR